MQEFKHTPVLLKAVLEKFNPEVGQNFIDATVGGGGHSRALLESTSPTGRLLGLDQDDRALAAAAENLKSFGARVSLAKGNFNRLAEIAEEKMPGVKFDGLLLDLGVSSDQLAGGRGMSFMIDEPLDMRMSDEMTITAGELINTAAAEDMEKIFRRYGQERWAREIAHEIVRRRGKENIATTKQLAELIVEVYKKQGSRSQHPHPATRVFQALRIEVNAELINLKSVLNQAYEVLKPGGKIAVISFHSLEDRIVKEFFKAHTDEWEVVNKKPIIADEVELKNNPRARSAKLRVALKK